MLLYPAEERLTLRNYPGAERGPSRRIWELDFLRGFTIILMCIDHFMFDLATMFSGTWMSEGGAAAAVAKFARMWWGGSGNWVGATRDVIWVVAISIFFGLCGGSTIFSRDNLTRAIKTFLAACVVTVGTYFAYALDIIGRSDMIYFGVLHMLAFATVIVSCVYALSRLGKKWGDLIFFLASLALCGACFGVNAALNEMKPVCDETLMFLHRHFAAGLSMGDYFPLLPNLGIAFAGAALITLVYGRRRSLLPRLDRGWNKPFRFMGRHTLLVVIIHQPAIMLLLAVITGVVVAPGNFVIF